MHSDRVRRLPRIVLAALAAVVTGMAVVSLNALSAPPARAAAPDISFSISPTSGSNYATDTGTLSWTVPSACVGNEVDVFLYKGTSSWNAAAINIAEGNTPVPGGQQTYFDFSTTYPHPAAATGSANWPNVSPGYQDWGYTGGVVYSTTAALVAAKGTGPYTIGIACVDGKTFTPITNSNGFPIATSLLAQLNGDGSWSASPNPAVPTNTTLTGTSVPLSGSVTLSATVTTYDGSAPSGGVNFYQCQFNQCQSGPPLNGSAPVPVGSDGIARWTGAVPGAAGATVFAAQYIPAPGSSDASSEGSGQVVVIIEKVALNLTAIQDPVTPSSVDVTVTATVTGGSLSSDAIQVVADGTNRGGAGFGSSGSSGVATYTVQGLANGSHTFGVNFIYKWFYTWTSVSSSGIELTESPAGGVVVGTGPYAAPMAVNVASSHDGLQVTAMVTGHTSSGGPTVAVPHGIVTFTDGSTYLGAAALTGIGSATATATVRVFSLPAGVNDLTATFKPANPALFSGSTGSVQLNLPAAETWVQAGLPVIAGTAAVGDTLTINPGTWGPGTVTLTYQWYADGSPIRGATGRTLVLGKAEFGKVIAADVTGSEPGDIASDVFTPAVGPVAKGTTKSSVPVITGTARVGRTLTVVVGSWTAGTGFRYQWYANGRPIASTTGVSLKLAKAERGEQIRVAVTGTRTGYTTVTRVSAPTSPVAK
jgi:hypothetical protein